MKRFSVTAEFEKSDEFFSKQLCQPAVIIFHTVAYRPPIVMIASANLSNFPLSSIFPRLLRKMGSFSLPVPSMQLYYL